MVSCEKSYLIVGQCLVGAGGERGRELFHSLIHSEWLQWPGLGSSSIRVPLWVQEPRPQAVFAASSPAGGSWVGSRGGAAGLERRMPPPCLSSLGGPPLCSGNFSLRVGFVLWLGFPHWIQIWLVAHDTVWSLRTLPDALSLFSCWNGGETRASSICRSLPGCSG